MIIVPAEWIADYLSPMLPLPTSLTPGGRPRGKIQCVLFDIYGTLFISGSGDIGISKKASPPVRKLEDLLHQFNIRKSPLDLMRELFHSIEDEHHRLRGASSTLSGFCQRRAKSIAACWKTTG